MSRTDYFVYILRCENGSFYTGYTTDLKRRFKEHLEGTGGCKYTRSFKPLGIAGGWVIAGDKGLALRVEKYIKSLTKREKEELVLVPERLVEKFEGCLLLPCGRFVE